jgi:predicted nucleotidyltransferase component of viral defense system
MNEQSLKDRLQTISKEQGIRFNECWKKLLLERFLIRLSKSKYAQKLVFKGGFLLAYLMETGRETTDLDFLLTSMSINEDEIKIAVGNIISNNLQDGFLFAYENIEVLEQPHMAYSGYRITLKASFGKMRDKIQIDIGIGDIVKPTLCDLPLFQYKGNPMFENEMSLLAYPPETIFAEKLETIISKGATNSRMKDYHDLLLLIRKQGMIDLAKLKLSVKNTFQHRGTNVELIDFSEEEIGVLEKLWVAHCGNLRNPIQLPGNIFEVILEINSFINAIAIG